VRKSYAGKKLQSEPFRDGSPAHARGRRLPPTRRALLGLLLFLVSPLEPGAVAASPPGVVFPMAVWYGGGKARAPMLEADPRSKKELWRRDLTQIKALGFNAIRSY